MEKPLVKFEDFQRLDLAIARIVSAERIENSEKMLKLKISTGDEERVVLAGIAQDYDPDELIGQKVVVLLNLEPKKMLGIESKGMLMAAEGGAIVSLLKPDKDIPEGSRIR